MYPLLTSILRRPNGLYAVINRCQEEFVVPKPPGKDVESPPLMDCEEPFVEEVVPLAEVPKEFRFWPDYLGPYWSDLGDVSSWNDETLIDVLTIVTNTITAPECENDRAPVLSEVPERPPPFRPTAAHPRAYKGTRARPPKRPQPDSVNLQPHLCVLASEERILARLAPHFEKVTEWIELQRENDVFPTTGPECLRPYAQCWPAEYSKQVAKMPPDFRRAFLWLLTGRDWTYVTSMLNAYWTLDLEHNTALRCAVVRLCYFCKGRYAPQWCGVIARIPPHRRTAFTELLIETHANGESPDEAIAEGLVRADALSSDAVYRHRMYYALKTVAKGHTLSFALDGFELANEYDERATFDTYGSVEGAGEAVRTYVEYISDIDYFWPARTLLYWEECALLDGLTEVYGADLLRSLPPESVSLLVDKVTSAAQDLYEESVRPEQWRYLKRSFPEFVEYVHSISEPYRRKAIEFLGELISYWRTAEEYDRILWPALQQLRRLFAAPSTTTLNVTRVLVEFTDLTADAWTVFVSASDAPFRKLEAASCRTNEMKLLADGIRTFVEDMPAFTAHAFARFPRQLLRTARTLGVVDTVVRKTLLREFNEHPLRKADVSVMGAESLVRLVERFGSPGEPSPVPRRLTEYVRGARELRPAQVERDVQIVRDRWLGFQLDVLERIAFDRMADGYPAVERTGQLKHALMLQQLAEEHRRGLRRLLRAHLAGDETYVDNHVRTREWYAKHPRVDEAVWRNGLGMRVETSRHGVLHLMTERDPLEVLRLGTYVGTCLGIGGLMCCSAAAIVLDVNKHVVYARDRSGHVVARQLLAVADDERLICFVVYPDGVGRTVQAAFRDFDRQLADSLGLDIHRQRHDDDSGGEYEIANIVSSYFYDDDAWNLSLRSRDENASPGQAATM